LWFKEEIKLNKNALIYKNFSRKEKMSCAKNFSIEHLIKIQIIQANGKVSKKEGSVNKKKCRIVLLSLCSLAFFVLNKNFLLAIFYARCSDIEIQNLFWSFKGYHNLLKITS